MADQLYFHFPFVVVCLHGDIAIYLVLDHTNHIFSKSLSSGDDNDRDEYLQKDKYKGFQISYLLSSCDDEDKAKTKTKTKTKTKAQFYA